MPIVDPSEIEMFIHFSMIQRLPVLYFPMDLDPDSLRDRIIGKKPMQMFNCIKKVPAVSSFGVICFIFIKILIKDEQLGDLQRKDSTTTCSWN